MLKEWKNRKFISSTEDVADGFKHLIILLDFNYWVKHTDNLEKWCKDYGCKREGLTVSIPDDKTLTLFYLRWV